MQLSNDTINVLKNFGAINQGILFKKGKVLKTMSSGKNILAEVTIKECEPVVKGQTSASSYKPAILENGVRIMVPPFIESGEEVIVNTTDFTYVSRAKS